MSRNSGKAQRVVRHSRVRKKILGTSIRPRLSVYRSLNNIYAQVIDDELGRTIAAASSLETDVVVGEDGKMGLSRSVGQLVAKRTKAEGIETVVFDRGGYKYHGRVKAVADAAREEGLVF